jgi:hypothetical protein
LQKLNATPDGDSSLLDHSLFLYGSGMSNGNQHIHTNLPGCRRGSYRPNPPDKDKNLRLDVKNKAGKTPLDLAMVPGPQGCYLEIDGISQTSTAALIRKLMGK